MTEYGSKVKPEKVAQLERSLRSSLAPREDLWLIVKAVGMKPMIDYIVVTNARVMAVSATDARAIKNQVFSHEFVAVSVAKTTFSPRMLTLRRPDGSTTKIGDVARAEDVTRLIQVVEHLQQFGDGQRAAAHVEQARASERAEADSLLTDAVVVSNNITGGEVSAKAQEQIRAHARPGERPWFVLSSGTGGVLAAFDDRLMIIKTGAMTSLMAGSLGGGRMTTMMFHDITGLEYNAGMASGVLEVLTASYQGTANHDFWQGTARGRNANSGDPYTLSNTLPLDKQTHARALGQLNELRMRIAKAKMPTVVVAAPASAQPARPSMTDELAKLGKLRGAGVLTDLEFTEAKAALLAGLRADA